MNRAPGLEVAGGVILSLDGPTSHWRQAAAVRRVEIGMGQDQGDGELDTHLLEC